MGWEQDQAAAEALTLRQAEDHENGEPTTPEGWHDICKLHWVCDRCARLGGVRKPWDAYECDTCEYFED